MQNTRLWIEFFPQIPAARTAPPAPLLHSFATVQALARGLRSFRFSHLQCGLPVFFFQLTSAIYIVSHNLCYPFNAVSPGL